MLRLTLCLMAAGTLAATAPSPEWQAFAPTNGGFTVMMPAAPVRSELYTPTPKHGLIRTSSATVYDSTHSTFTVSWTVYADSVALTRMAPVLTFDRARDALLKTNGWTLASERDLTVNGRPGRTITFKEPDGDLAQIRFFIAGRQFIQLAAGTPDAEPAKAIAQRFLDSFELK